MYLFTRYIRLYGSGKTENNAKLDLRNNIDAAIEHVKEVGEWGDYLPLKGNIDVGYKYDSISQNNQP